MSGVVIALTISHDDGFKIYDDVDCLVVE